jgi:hypothetical protein
MNVNLDLNPFAPNLEGDVRAARMWWSALRAKYSNLRRTSPPYSAPLTPVSIPLVTLHPLSILPCPAQPHTTYVSQSCPTRPNFLLTSVSDIQPGSVMEEALISRVSACTSVLCLPNGGQLGYRGSVINFTNDLMHVAEQLPRTPKETGIIIYAVEGAPMPLHPASHPVTPTQPQPHRDTPYHATPDY